MWNKGKIQTQPSVGAEILQIRHKILYGPTVKRQNHHPRWSICQCRFEMIV